MVEVSIGCSAQLTKLMGGMVNASAYTNDDVSSQKQGIAMQLGAVLHS